MTNITKYFDLVAEFEKQIQEIKPQAIAEINERLSVIDAQIEPMKLRREWNDLLKQYTPSDADIENAKQVFQQIPSMINPAGLANNGANENFLFDWYCAQIYDNQFRNKSETLGNAILCAVLGKIPSGLFSFDADKIHERHGFKFGMEYFLKPLMPKQTEKKLAEIATLEDERSKLKRHLAEIEADSEAA